MESEIAWMQQEQEANVNAGQQDGDGDGEGGGAGGETVEERRRACISLYLAQGRLYEARQLQLAGVARGEATGMGAVPPRVESRI